MTNIFFETEFVHIDNQIRLVDIALVAESGESYQAFDEDVDWELVSFTPTLLNIVHPNIVKKTTDFKNFITQDELKKYNTICEEVKNFIDEYEDQHLYTYYTSFNRILLSKIYYGDDSSYMLNLPYPVAAIQDRVNYLCVDKKTFPEYPSPIVTVLDNVKWDMHIFEYLKTVDDIRTIKSNEKPSSKRRRKAAMSSDM